VKLKASYLEINKLETQVNQAKNEKKKKNDMVMEYLASSRKIEEISKSL